MPPPISAEDALPLFERGVAPPGLRVEGMLKFTEGNWTLPANLSAEAIDLSACPEFDAVPPGLRCYELNLAGTKVRELPGDLAVDAILNLSNCEELLRLPANLKVGTLNLSGCRSLAALPEGLDVWFLDMTGCWNFSAWPARSTIRSGRLGLRGCIALASLPAGFGRLASLNIRDCPNLRELPNDLRVSGWIDIAQSGLAETKRLPASLAGVGLRWQGVRIEERIFTHPETITVAEIMGEANAERRRVLLDRFGVSRFMAEANATIRDEDADPGGKRQLLSIDMKEDEALVTLSCICPSTGRHYFLRVPPATTTCHQAAAWIAGFDDPAEYRPLLET